LPRRQREVIDGEFYADLAPAEIAEAQGVSRSTVYNSKLGDDRIQGSPQVACYWRSALRVHLPTGSTPSPAPSLREDQKPSAPLARARSSLKRLRKTRRRARVPVIQRGLVDFERRGDVSEIGMTGFV